MRRDGSREGPATRDLLHELQVGTFDCEQRDRNAPGIRRDQFVAVIDEGQSTLTGSGSAAESAAAAPAPPVE